MLKSEEEEETFLLNCSKGVRRKRRRGRESKG